MRYVYSDGSAPFNGHKDCVAGYAAIETSSSDVEIGAILQTTSGFLLPGLGRVTPTSIRAELQGAIAALSLTDRRDVVTFFSDSAYVINGINQKWYLKWRKTGTNSLGKSPANLDLWNSLVELIEERSVTAVHIKGHKGHRFQEMCDTLAVIKSKEGREFFEKERKKR